MIPTRQDIDGILRAGHPDSIFIENGARAPRIADFPFRPRNGRVQRKARLKTIVTRRSKRQTKLFLRHQQTQSQSQEERPARPIKTAAGVE